MNPFHFIIDKLRRRKQIKKWLKEESIPSNSHVPIQIVDRVAKKLVKKKITLPTMEDIKRILARSKYQKYYDDRIYIWCMVTGNILPSSYQEIQLIQVANAMHQLSKTDKYRHLVNRWDELLVTVLNLNLCDGCNELCSICLDVIHAEQLRILSCGHLFHKDCIKQWFAFTRKCPLCRTKQPKRKHK